MINGNIKFFFDNLINDNSSFTFTSASVDLANKLYNNKRDDRLQSSGSDDATPEVWEVDFENGGKQFNRFFVDNHNIRDGDIKYWDGATFVDFTPAISFDSISEVIIPDELDIEDISNPFGITDIRGVDSNDDIILAAGEGAKISSSTDGGLTWSALIANPFTATTDLNGIAFSDRSSVGPSSTVVTGGRTEIGRSTDSGATWTLKTNPLTFNMRAIAANQTNTTFVAVGDGGEIARSTDDGDTWGSLISNPFGGTSIVSISSNGNNYVAVGDGSKLARSTDDGVSWGSLLTIPITGNFLSVTNNGDFYVAIMADKIIRSIDNGATWKEVSHSYTESFKAITSFGQTFVITFDCGLMAISCDNGESFGEVTPNNITGLEDLISPHFSRSTFLVGSAGGKIFRALFDFDISNYYEFNAVISEKIQITMNKTQVIDEEKSIGDALCFREIGTVQTNPSEVDFEFSDFANTSNTGTGGNVHASFGEKWNAEITFSDACKKDVDLFRKLKNLNESFFVLPGGGIDREQEGFRLRDIFRVNFVNSFEPQVKGNLFGIGTILAMELGEV